MILIELFFGRQKTPDPLSHTSLCLDLPGQSAQIQMGMTVYQSGKQGSLIMIPGQSLRPLAPDEGKGSHVQNRSFGDHHCTIFDGRLGYRNDQAGPVENRTRIRPTKRLGGEGAGRIEIYLFPGHISSTLASMAAGRYSYEYRKFHHRVHKDHKGSLIFACS
jgi:hypothetical protein